MLQARLNKCHQSEIIYLKRTIPMCSNYRYSPKTQTFFFVHQILRSSFLSAFSVVQYVLYIIKTVCLILVKNSKIDLVPFKMTLIV